MGYVARIVRLLPLLFLLGGSTISACSEPAGPSGGCCKVCTTGKACGNSCISRTKTCHKGAGYACDG